MLQMLLKSKKNFLRKDKLILNIIFIFLFFLSIDFVMAAPPLLITFPEDSAKGSWSRVRFAGVTSPKATVKVNGKSVKVYPNGAFVGLVDLIEGINKIEFIAEESGEITKKYITVIREPALKSSPEWPLTIDTVLFLPDADMILQPGDILNVQFKGSPGGEASFSIGKLRKNIPMVELPPALSGPLANVKGIYVGSYEVQPGDNLPFTRITFKLKKNNKIKTAKSTAKIAIQSPIIPTLGKVTSDSTPVYTGPYLAWHTILPKDVILQIIGWRGGKAKIPAGGAMLSANYPQKEGLYKIKLSNTEVGWVAAENIELLPPGTQLPTGTISAINIKPLDNKTKIFIPLPARLPYRVEQILEPPSLELTIYGVTADTDWITTQLEDPVVKLLRWRQVEDRVYRLYIDLNFQQQWGYDIYYEGGYLVLEIKKPPKISSPPKFLTGLTVVLDAGHGGVEPGAIGPTGVKEKDVNLGYTKALARLLEQAGAKVILTWDTDPILSQTNQVRITNIDPATKSIVSYEISSSISLKRRAQIAKDADADILICLHNNSIPYSANPEISRGTGVFYYHPQSLELARRVYARLLEITSLNGIGVIWFNRAMVRPHQMLSILIEGAFMSHPEEEMLLNTQEFQEKLALAIFKGLEDFLTKNQ